MKYAICNELYEGWDLRDVCRHARERGYTGVELAPFTLSSTPTLLSPEQRAEIRDTIEKSEMEVVGLHWLLAKTDGFSLTTDDPTTQAQTADYFGELARLCSDLGGTVMVLGSPQQRNFPESMRYEQAESNAIKVLRNVIPTLEECGVTLALEPLGPEEGNFMLTADSAIRMIEELDHQNVQLHLDVKAMSTESKPIEDIIHSSAQHLVHFHANDPNRQGPGMGTVNYEPIFTALREAKYNGWISVEVFDYSPGIDALVEQSIDYMKRIDLKTSERT